MLMPRYVELYLYIYMYRYMEIYSDFQCVLLSGLLLENGGRLFLYALFKSLMAIIHFKRESTA